jgi:eukaryotic-like serine/threonine-protein kinase
MSNHEQKEPQPGEVFGHYRVEVKRGQGAFGAVYLARDLRLQRPVALKIEHSPQDANTWGRLLREARAASALSHPNLCAIYDIGEEAGLHFIAMEFVEGRTVKELGSAGTLAEAQVIAYAKQIASGLGHAHHRHILHRDLKSSNVIVTPDGQAKLLDFGLAQRFDGGELEQLTQSRQSLAELGGLAGTLSYLAPEVLRGRPASPQSDLWSFGVLLYEMLAGALPFQGNTPFELSMAVMVEPPRPLPSGTSPALRAIIQKCLEKDLSRRYRSADDVLRDLDVGPLPFRRNRSARRVAAVVVVAVAVLLLAWRDRDFLVAPPRPELPASVRPPAPPPGGTMPVPLVKPKAPVQSPPRGEGNPKVQVWVNTRSGTYHCPGTRWYQKTAQGQLMSQRQAQQKRYRPASGKPCP